MPDAGSHTGTPPVPRILPRSQHNLSRSLIDPDAVKVMYRLVRHGYKAYLVGGSVRDLLLAGSPRTSMWPPMPVRPRSGGFFATAA
jgi:hypothetical protein